MLGLNTPTDIYDLFRHFFTMHLIHRCQLFYLLCIKLVSFTSNFSFVSAFHVFFFSLGLLTTPISLSTLCTNATAGK